MAMNQLSAKPISLFRSLDDLPQNLRGSLLAIGNFDGVHLGQQAVIAAARQKADALGCPLGVMLFDPHPRSFFAPDADSFRLTRLATRARLMADIGVDFTLALPFNADMAACSAEDFIEMILSDNLNVRGVAIGHDFRFGKDRRGDVEMLRAHSQTHGFEVVMTEAVMQPNSVTPYSSSAIRAALRDGDPETAAQLLRHSWAIEGDVTQGDQRGRPTRFATANMAPGVYLLPTFGVYVVPARVQAGELMRQHVHGLPTLRPPATIRTAAPRLETHLFDFDADIYGCSLSVALLGFIRPEQKFDGLDALKQQIAKDSTQAREMLAAMPADC